MEIGEAGEAEMVSERTGETRSYKEKKKT